MAWSLREGYGLAPGNVSLEICFDVIGCSRRKLKAAVWGNALAAIHLYFGAGGELATVRTETCGRVIYLIRTPSIPSSNNATAADTNNTLRGALAGRCAICS